LSKISREVEILPATFGLKAAVMGAVSLIMQKVLSLDYKNWVKSEERVEEGPIVEREF